MKVTCPIDYTREGIAAMCGPGTNILLALIFGFLPWGRVFSGINLALGCLNLIPFFPLDGGRMLCALMAYLTDEPTARRMMETLSLLFAVILGVIGFQIAVQFGNITLLLLSGWMFVIYFNGKVYD